MQKGLRDAIARTITKLEAGCKYEWTSGADCNCGLLAQELLLMDRDEFVEVLEESGYSGSWSYRIKKTICKKTGLSDDPLIIALADAGLSAEDVCSLEQLSDPEILERGGLKRTFPFFFRKSRSNLIAYLRAWIGE